jgi:hypothetical protein
LKDRSPVGIDRPLIAGTTSSADHHTADIEDSNAKTMSGAAAADGIRPTRCSVLGLGAFPQYTP